MKMIYHLGFHLIGGRKMSRIAELSYKSEDKRITFSELDQDMDMEEFHRQCKELAAAIGYHPHSIEEWFDQHEAYDDIITKLNDRIRVLEESIPDTKPWLDKWDVYS